MSDRKFLDTAYGLDGVEKTIGFYDEWANSYEDEIRENGYATPGRCAAALAQFVEDKTQAVLDFGCGTGLSGKALADAGFTTIDGTDLSEGMLAKAGAHGVYRDLWLGNIDTPLTFEPGTYPAIAAIGVIGSGAAPVDTIDLIMEHLGPGGYFVFSFNDHTLEDPGFEGRISAYIDAGGARLLFKEYGPHLPGQEMMSNVYVLQKS